MNREKQHNKLVPELRFSEFNSDYINIGFSELGDIKIGLTHKPDYIESGVPFLSSKNISGGYIDYEDIKYISKKKFLSMPDSTKPKVGDILFTRVGSNLGNPIIVEKEKEFGIFVSLGIFRVNSKASNKYVRYWMDSDYFWKQVEQKVAGGAKMNLNTTWLKEFRLSIPTQKEEQQKIANCLSSLDNLITIEAEKLENLKEHKKGLLQQLIPAIGKSKPQYRFPDFKYDGDWEITSLNKVSTSIFDGTHQTPKYTDKGIPFFSVENIVSGKKNKFISNEAHTLAIKTNKPEKGDILITRIGNIGYTKVIDWDFDFSIYVTLAVIKKSDSFISKYLNGYLQSSRYQKEIQSKSLLNAAPIKINMDELRKTEVLLPPSKLEQEKIGNCLSSVDDLLLSQTEKIKNLKEHKKGLMQQLFPNINNIAV